MKKPEKERATPTRLIKIDALRGHATPIANVTVSMASTPVHDLLQNSCKKEDSVGRNREAVYYKYQ